MKHTYGVKRRTTKEKVTSDTLFQAGSISKPVFAVAIMRLVELGTLDIDTDISEYLAGYDVPTYDNQKHKITLRQILSHHAGLNLHGFAGYQQGQKIPTVEQILTGVFPSNHLKLKLIKDPETGFQYSGGGYVLAQKIITDVCKLNFCDLMNDLVFSPLFMTTPSDLARFGIEIMKALKSESTFLEKKTAELMTTKAYENSPYGVGFAVNQSKKELIFGHGGSNLGYYSNMVFCPDEGSGIVVMQNSDIGMRIRDEVTNAFKEIYGW